VSEDSPATRRPRLRPDLGTLGAAALVSLAVPPPELAPLIFVAFVPWWAALERCRSVAEAAVQGMWLNFLLGIASAWWLVTAVPFYLGASHLVGAVVLLAYAAINQIQLVPVATVAWWATRGAPARSVFGIAALAFVYTGIDWATPKVFRDTIGFMLHDFAVLRQLAALGGVPLLTFVVLSVNVGLFAVWRVLRAQGARAVLRPGLRVAGVFAALYALAFVEASRLDGASARPERSVRVGFVQGSVDPAIKQRWSAGDPDAAREALEVYLASTRRLLAREPETDLVIWPETTFPGVFRKPERDAQLLLNVAFDREIAALGVPLAFGAYDREDRSDRRVLRNALYLVEPRPGQPAAALSPMQVYHKSMLLPVGEYLPGIPESWSRSLFPGGARLASGDGAAVLSLSLRDGGRLRIGPSICYEDVFPDYMADLARQGADLLVNISNDGWLGDLGAARFHLIFARLRSIETRLPQLRVTNSGYSALMAPDGAMTHETGFGVEASGVVEVAIGDRAAPLRVRWGDWFGPTALALGVASALLLRRRADA